MSSAINISHEPPKKEKTSSLRVLEGGGGGAQKISSFEGVYYGRPVIAHVKEFGALVGAIFLFVAAYVFYSKGFTVKGYIWIGVGVLFPIIGYCTPKLLFYPWKWWMAFAVVLGSIMTRVILSLAWTLILLPTAVIVRVLKKNPISSHFDKNASTYWDERKEDPDFFKKLERQF